MCQPTFGGLLYHVIIVLPEFCFIIDWSFFAVLSDISKIDFSLKALSVGFNQRQFLKGKTL